MSLAARFTATVTLMAVTLASILAISIPAGAQSPATSFRDCPDCPEMVTIPSGSFLIGLSGEEAKRDSRQESLLYKLTGGWKWAGQDQPQHIVNISRSFSIGKYPITRGEFALFVKEMGFQDNNPCEVLAGRYSGFDAGANWHEPGFQQTDREPVVCVSWSEAQAYINWLNKKSGATSASEEGGPYRLPSEAEWEYAARAGTRTTRWWGDALGKDNAVCTHCGSPWDNKKTVPVGLHGANAFGLADMLGNVWQWTADCWNDNYSGAAKDGSARSTGDCTKRVMRGGSWRSDPETIRSSARLPVNANEHWNFGGFRVVKTIQNNN